MEYTILLADDEAEIRELLRLYLDHESYRVLEANDGLEALDLLKKEHVDLCVLDVMMPKMDGFCLLKEIRKKSNMPVLMLSAKDGDSDKILGLNLGADDYLSKPFNPLEAVARINASIRRFYALGADIALGSGEDRGKKELRVQDLRLDREACTLYRGEEEIDLTSVEYRIMDLFMSHPGKVFTKQQIYERGWEEEYIVADNNIMVCISKLRSKLDDGDNNHYIRTIRGLGYRMEKKR
ncbi:MULTISPECIES: response regulator transcription factor [Shuttleworthella]|uniref:Stage 0 sporulation protein A homolog n=1 Tax=Shuttleworthella satelles DSM 14600 TaxID=626523 RepID=C4GCI7_9FIRM|nr:MULTISPECIES: response regulator transcription factor [Shuttleworthia]EEP27687.1 response regulator receiver domain protein [Shuttleworthia satelles DSM 14600]EUB15269.1 response regulator receiver domain protein [Shuttleworthia sp. MSX8B]